MKDKHIIPKGLEIISLLFLVVIWGSFTDFFVDVADNDTYELFDLLGNTIFGLLLISSVYRKSKILFQIMFVLLSIMTALSVLAFLSVLSLSSLVRLIIAIFLVWYFKKHKSYFSK